jgi:hypothetical protein
MTSLFDPITFGAIEQCERSRHIDETFTEPTRLFQPR